MPLPDLPPTRVQAPAWAGIGLVFRPRVSDPCWPEDWWQRDYDTYEYDCPPPLYPTERHLRIPEAPPP